MDITSLSSNSTSLIILTRRSLPSTRHNQIHLPQPRGSLSFNPISCSSSSSSSTKNDDADSVQAQTTTDPVQAPITTPPAPVEVRFRRRSRRQARKLRESSVQSPNAKVMETAPKKWEDMTFNEKALELYMGEKGALFWLNKFAYASIFIMVGGWILFRFVGPALNLYQLDTPPLSPTDVLKGSS